MPTKLRNTTAGADVVTSVVYGVSGEMTQMTMGNGGVESRGYNVNGQLTSLTGPGGVSLTYVYSATQNNGQITSVVDSGETITMQYDALKRLISTAGNGWSQSYTFDGFGNLATKTGVNAPSWNGGSLPATNRVPGFSYDLNGNQLNHNGFTLSYDILNRLEKAESSSQKSEYDYAADNKRIVEKRWTGTGSSWTSVGEWVYFYGIDGKRLGRYALSSGFAWSTAGTSVWFGGKLAQKVDGAGAITWPNEDRLGSVGRYHAFGEDRGSGSPAADNEKFATYTRDGVTGLDYADQRWHSPGVGRFLTADPYQASAGPGDPGSWNRYAYVLGDPIGISDPSGLAGTETSYQPPIMLGCSTGGGFQGSCSQMGGVTGPINGVWNASTTSNNLNGVATPYNPFNNYATINGRLCR